MDNAIVPFKERYSIVKTYISVSLTVGKIVFRCELTYHSNYIFNYISRFVGHIGIIL